MKEGNTEGGIDRVNAHWSEHFIKMVEAWVLAIGITAFAAVAYHAPMLKPGIVTNWKAITWVCLLLAFLVTYASVDPWIDAIARGLKKRKLGIRIATGVASVAMYMLLAWYVFAIADEWVTNSTIVQWCKDHPASSEPICKPLRG